jgi:hypothetical protein
MPYFYLVNIKEILMKLETSLMGLFIFLLCVLPFVIITLNNRKRKKKMIQELFSLAESNNCKISKYDLMNNLSIGIDEHKKMIFFTKTINEEKISQQAVLQEIQKCRLINLSKTVGNSNDKYKAVDKFELVLIHHDPGKPAIALEFYNTDYDNYPLSDELLLLEKWDKIINQQLSSFQLKK